MVGAELHRGVDRLDRADALVERVDRLVDHRQQDAVDDEGREVLGRDRRLAQLQGELAGRREGRVVGRDAADQLDQLITGTGFMKCMPMNLPGRSVAAASRVIEIDEVLVAISASGFSAGHELLEDLALDRFLLGRRLDHHVAIAERRVIGGVRIRASAAALSSSRDAAARDLAGQVPSIV